ncbi:receptor-type tyrosine-protein phosphatase T-like [Gigantopelta aegis]|uniref:receptor-type tyrosine-protein phosphatase T-like n=1 Tax=Gigantopelta aegis TaxID=1735272 RepID=UPI001B88DCCD|nr:receptor-type tyrosine-protein phosphatase T-like [Gigantopelta aegis]
MSCDVRHCLGSTYCDVEYGRCVGGCQAGWELPDCTTECHGGTFGRGCKSKCSERHCKGDSSSCDVQNGTCQHGCQPGWKSSSCNAQCSNTTYGDNCAMLCSDRHCSNTASCIPETGQCEGECASGWTGTTCKEESSASTDFPVGPAVGGIAAVLVVIVVVVVIIVFVRRRQANNKDRSEHTPLPEKTENPRERRPVAAYEHVYINVESPARYSTKTVEINDTDVSDVDEGEPEEQETDEEEEVKDADTYYNDVQPAPTPFSVPEGGFDVAELEDIIDNIRRQPGGFEAEFLKLPSGFKHPYTDSQIQENRCKNRFAGYYPYNNNRVKLSPLPNLPHSDYINASYVDAYEKTKYFIASQAPNNVTLPDFWRMIWEQDCGHIVMLTNLVEGGKHKCEPYWKDSGSMHVGLFDVVVKDIIERADYTIRKIQVTQKKSKKCKTFDHYHFTSWPDHGVPKVLDLLEFFWLTRETPPSRPGPVLVHCSAGIGRTGTYIALHILTDEVKKAGRMNVLEMMTKIRDQRKNMIQTKNQYECLFTSMLEVVKYGQTSMATSTYTQKYAKLKGSVRMGHKTLDELAEVIASTDISDKGLPLKNKLWVGGKDDLFAVQAPSKMLSKGYLLVYTPQRTENLLWKLIMENDSLTLVTLGNKNESFVPRPSHSSNYRNVTVTTVTETHVSREITLRILSVEMKGSDEKKEIANFSVQTWTNTSNSSTVINCLTTLTEQILDRQNNLKFHPVTVVFE